MAAGGIAWLAKMAVIAATDGAVSGAAATTASLFYLAGVVLMAAGLAGVAVALASRRGLFVRALAGIAGLLSFFVVYMTLEGIAKAAVGDAGPAWLDDEVGILATGACLMVAGLLIVRQVTARRTSS